MENNYYSLDIPTVWEMLQADRIFTEYVQKHAHETQYPLGSPLHSSKKVIIKCALSAVWMAGRRHEHNISGKNLEE